MTDQERSSGTTPRSRGARGEGEEVGQEVRQVARDAGESAKEVAREATQEIRGQANRAVEQGSESLATRSDALAEALRAASSTLAEREQDALRRFAERAAVQVEGMGERIRQNDVGSLIDGLEQMAREHTPAFLTGSFVGGLALARFLRSSAPESEGRTYEGTRTSRGNGWTEEDRW